MGWTSRSLILAAVSCVVGLLPGVAGAGIHFAIIPAAGAGKATARLNLATAEPAQAQITVYPPGASMITDTITFDVNFFATSASSAVPGIQNLFVGAGAGPALVRADVVPAAHSNAVLELLSGKDGDVVFAMPPVTESTGAFIVPIGELHRGVQVLIGNIGDDAAIEVKYGATASINMGVVPRHGVLTIPVDQGNITLRIIGTGPAVNLLCQLVVDTGKTLMSSCGGL